MEEKFVVYDLVREAGKGSVKKVLKILQKSNGDLPYIKARYFKDALWMAVDKDYVMAIRTLVSAGADVNCTEGFSKQTILMRAVDQRKHFCVTELIQLGADINCVDSEGRNALMLATISGKEDCLKILIEAGADLNMTVKGSCDTKPDCGFTALMLAAKTPHLNCLKLMLEAGADVNVKTSDGQTALTVAVSCVNDSNYPAAVECVRFLTRFGADVNVQTSDGETALMKVTKWNTDWRDDLCSPIIECSTILTQARADVTKVNREGQNVLMYAASKNSMVHLLPVLVKADAVIDQQDLRGMTELSHAVSKGCYLCVRWLVNSGASVSICDHSGKTPLHYLMFLNHNDEDAEQCLEALLSKQPNVNATDSDGMTPLMYVAQKCVIGTRTMTMLLSHGAELNVLDHRGQSALIHSVASDLGGFNRLINVQFLLKKGANFRIGKLAAGRLSRLVAPYNDFGLIKLQVGNKVDLKAPMEDFVSVISKDGRSFLMFLITNGVMPSPPTQGDRPPQKAWFYSPTSLIKMAVQLQRIGMVKYLITTCFLCSADLKFLSPGSRNHNAFSISSKVETLVKNLGSQPWPLVKLCFVAVSTAFGASPGRQERVKNSQLPLKLQNMLLFQEPWSRLCVHQWDKIPLTFSSEEYEKLPQPRPLLYHWPVGRALVPCDCIDCDETMYKFEDSEEGKGKV